MTDGWERILTVLWVLTYIAHGILLLAAPMDRRGLALLVVWAATGGIGIYWLNCDRFGGRKE